MAGANNVAGTVVGVDVGGTFTDVFFLDEEDGSCRVAKVPSTRDDQSRGIRDGIAEQMAELGGVSLIVHGTTVGTNALLERKGAPTGIITTQGFRDLIEMRRRDRPETWGLWGMFDPVVPRDLRIEVDERVLADGTVDTEVDAGEVEAAARTLMRRGAEAVCIFFMNSYANDANEGAAVAAVRKIWPNQHVTASSEILPEIREFERCSTATLNAYLQPHLGDYLERLDAGLRDGGFEGEILIVQSNGGVMPVDMARAFPVRTALSGPAAGVIAGAHIGVSAGYPNLITCDMGGTSFDVSLVAGGESALAAQTAVDFGMVVRTPMIEITTIGAGGGSIAWVDRGGLLQIGPESAGADPGPVCYGLGNEKPTVTDANLVLGRINGERPIGGKLDRLDTDAARAAIAADVGEPLGIGVMEAAEAVIRVANSKMVGAIRLVSVERGHDPEKFVAMPFGGGGALHTGALIKDIGLSKALVPRFPGVTSALGCVIADMRFDRVHTLNALLADLDLSELDREMAATAKDGAIRLSAAKVAFERIENVFELDMLYLGQTHTVSVRLPVQMSEAGSGVTREMIETAFEDTYRGAFGRLLEGIETRVLNLRVAVIGRRPKFDLSLLGPAATASLEDARSESRQVWIDGEWREADIYRRLDLPQGAVVPGPALLEQPDTTIFIDPDLEGAVDKFGNLVISRKDQP
ncbi:MAG: hydantoinase/oxoprolinase family protein [Rhodospirillales bacterium]|jgi:N-methylhydantoinase A|nr:hydantoin utilization protein A [Rhodospirillaceae bacterium]MDP6429180.1 hydantoinase/oxoprolinase family protein [Rhodospirillales bacterium]MDP6646537.1 hydantoinase/oxoprolinase family protein [Rhodospirillales bacterium]MDP6842195.1 hydantoinase/oxoprolinase family protein [Rhodospirillales bacterium]